MSDQNSKVLVKPSNRHYQTLKLDSTNDSHHVKKGPSFGEANSVHWRIKFLIRIAIPYFLLWLSFSTNMTYCIMSHLGIWMTFQQLRTNRWQQSETEKKRGSLVTSKSEMLSSIHNVARLVLWIYMYVKVLSVGHAPKHSTFNYIKHVLLIAPSLKRAVE